MTGPGGDTFGPSQALWQPVQLDLLNGFGDRDLGWIAGDDFRNFATNAAPSSNKALYYSEGNTYNSYEGASTQTVVPADSTWTVPSAFTLYTPNGSGVVAAGGSVFPTPGQITLTPTGSNTDAQLVTSPNASGTAAGIFSPYPITTGVQGDVFFEARIRLSDLNTSTVSWFVGLAGTCVAASGVPVGDGSFSATPSLLGFGSLSGDASGKIGLVYNKASGTVSHQSVANMAGLNLMILGNATGIGAVGTSTGPSPLLNVAGPGGIPSQVAATWIGSYFKLGFRYRGGGINTLTPYINGIAQDGVSGPNKIVGSGTLSTNLGSAAPGTGSSTLWPADLMNFACGARYHGATVPTITIDWWRAAQLVY